MTVMHLIWFYQLIVCNSAVITAELHFFCCCRKLIELVLVLKLIITKNSPRNDTDHCWYDFQMSSYNIQLLFIF